MEDFRIPRRDWNSEPKQKSKSNLKQILEYLGGIETCLPQQFLLPNSLILEYLGGIETQLGRYAG